VLKNLWELVGERIGVYRLYCNVTNVIPISRRYFVIGYFDGVLTVLGMIIGAHLSGKASSQLIVSAGIATAIALGISSGWGAYEAERVEQRAVKMEKERALLKKVDGFMNGAHKFAIYISSIVHAISPIIAAAIPLSAYLFLPMNLAFILALSLGLSQLFVIGALMGKVSEMNVFLAGLRLVLAGVVTLAVVTILNPSHLIS
jgi:predicted membrane protein (TIGR00267 family)